MLHCVYRMADRRSFTRLQTLFLLLIWLLVQLLAAELLKEWVIAWHASTPYSTDSSYSGLIPEHLTKSCPSKDTGKYNVHMRASNTIRTHKRSAKYKTRAYVLHWPLVVWKNKLDNIFHVYRHDFCRLIVNSYNMTANHRSSQKS